MTDTPPAEDEEHGTPRPAVLTFTADSINNATDPGLWRQLAADVLIGELAQVEDDSGQVVAYQCAHPSLTVDDSDLLTLAADEPAVLAEIASEADKATTPVERRRKAKEVGRRRLAGLNVAAKQKLRADAEARTANPKGKKKAAATRGKGL